jgi:hypothetical protein
VNQRKFLLRLRLWVRLVVTKRQLRRTRRLVVSLGKKHEEDTQKLRAHYERLLAEERLKSESLSFYYSDRVMEAFKLTSGVAHTVHEAQGRVDEKLDPSFRPPPPNLEDTLYGDELDMFLDLKDGFFEAERKNGRGDAEIQRLWDTQIKDNAIHQARELILQ